MFELISEAFCILIRWHLLERLDVMSSVITGLCLNVVFTAFSSGASPSHPHENICSDVISELVLKGCKWKHAFCSSCISSRLLRFHFLLHTNMHYVTHRGAWTNVMVHTFLSVFQNVILRPSDSCCNKMRCSVDRLQLQQQLLALKRDFQGKSSRRNRLKWKAAELVFYFSVKCPFENLVELNWIQSWATSALTVSHLMTISSPLWH